MVFVLTFKDHDSSISLLHSPGHIGLKNVISPLFQNTRDHISVESFVKLLDFEFFNGIEVFKDDLNCRTFAHATIVRIYIVLEFDNQILTLYSSVLLRLLSFSPVLIEP